VDVERVLVDVTVTLPDGSSVTGLEKENFRLFEDGVEQKIVSLSREDAPISIGLIFDMSGSMSDKIDESRRGALEFLKAANPRDEFFLVSFSDRSEVTSPFTFDIEELQKRIISGQPKGRTALLDAIYMGLAQMKGARNAKHALLVISDGGDNHSRYNKAQIRNALKEGDCSVYAIGFFRFKDILRSIEEFNGPGLLSELAEITGGHMFPVSRLDQLPAIGAKIGVELRNRYVLEYKSTNARHDGSWRRIKVKVTPPTPTRPLSVYARSGYYSPRD
jgi:Ca-activated chloride channel family protein